MKTLPTFDYEQTHWKKGLQFVAGVDEVGRGAFAGPVVTAAVIFSPDILNKESPCIRKLLAEANDSKLLSPQKRKELSHIILEHAVSYVISEVSVQVINQIGIGKATQLAFTDSIMRLSIIPEHILMDAFYINSIEKEIQTPIIKGDQKSITIAAASIIAKVYRDELMTTLASVYPEFYFAENKGYGTKKHREMIGAYGLCNLHRTSFHLQKFCSS